MVLLTTSFLGNTLLLRSSTGNGHGIPTASQAVRIARYQPQTNPMNPKPPAIFNSLLICARSAAVVADATEKSAAAMKAKSMMRPKKVRVKNRFTRKVPMKKTKLAMHLYDV